VGGAGAAGLSGGSPAAAATGPLILLARPEPRAQAALDALRAAHWPPPGPRLPAHVTLLRQLPPSQEAELVGRLKAEARGLRAPVAQPLGVSERDAGVALRLACAALAGLHARLADAWAPLLAAPDRGPAWLHVTIAHGLEARAVRALARQLGAAPLPGPFGLVALELWRWRPTGPLERAARVALRP
jgi:hypothetical protein